MNRLENFKLICKEQKQKHDKKVQKWITLKEEQKNNYLDKCYAPRRKFKWRKLRYIDICPICLNELKKEHIQTYHYSLYEDVILYCRYCNYEYAAYIRI